MELKYLLRAGVRGDLFSSSGMPAGCVLCVKQLALISHGQQSVIAKYDRTMRTQRLCNSLTTIQIPNLHFLIVDER